MRVLLVEDDRMIGEVIEQSLRDASYAVDWVLDGQAALNAVLTQSYDVLLLDLGLPKKDGFEVLQTLRANRQSVPVLLVSARDALADRVRGLDAGADDYLIKPFDMAELLARMRAVARRNAGEGAQVLSNGAHELSVEVKMTEAAIFAIAHKQHRLIVSRVDRETMAAIEKTFRLPRARITRHVLAVLTEPEKS